MTLKLQVFGGIAPRKAPILLNDEEAQTAINMRTDRGSLIPIRGVTASTTVAATSRSFFNHYGQWLVWPTQGVDVVRSPVPNDAFNRIYYTGDGVPKYSYTGLAAAGNANGVKLGIKKPGVAFTVTKSGTVSGTSTLRYYVYTYVSPKGEESPPSAPVGINITTTQTANLTFTAETLTGYNLGAGSFRRVYRTAQGTSGTKYMFVKDVAIATLTTTDALLDAALGSELTSTNWFEPPSTLQGLKSTANGFLVAYTGNTLCPSEQFLPHAWNPNNVLAFPNTITAIAITGDSIIVFTTQDPYLVTGTTPATLSAVKIEHYQTCRNKSSIVNMEGYVMFASPDGLFQANANEMNNVTYNLLTRAQWQAYSPTTIKGYYYEGFYLGFSNTKQFAVDMRGSSPILIDLSGFNQYVDSYNDLTGDLLYLLDTLGNIVTWETGAFQTFTWKSKPIRLPVPICPACVRIYASSPVTFTLFADGFSVFSQSITNNSIVRLPSGYKARQLEMQITGSASIVESIAIATSVAELQ